MPTLASMSVPKKEATQKDARITKKPTKETKDKEPKEKQEEIGTIKMIENKVKNEETKKKNFEKQAKVILYIYF